MTAPAGAVASVHDWRVQPQERERIVSAASRGEAAPAVHDVVDRLRDEGLEVDAPAFLVSAKDASETRVAIVKNGRPNPPARPENPVPSAMDLRALASIEPEAPRFVVKDWLPQGEVTLFAGHGGSGKSAIALHLAVCVAMGCDFFGMKVQRQRVAFLSLEDPAAILHWRLARICAWLNVDMAALAGWLTVWDGTDTAGALMESDHEGLKFTVLHGWLAEAINGHAGLVIDGVSDAFGGNENVRREVRRFVREMRRIVPREGFVLLLSHVNLAAARVPETSQGFSGSTAWNNSVRARWYLRPDGDDALRLEVQKSNHAPVGASLRLEWNASAHLFVGELTMPVSKLERDLAASDDRAAVFDLVHKAQADGNPVPAASSGPRSAWHVLSAMPGFPPGFTGKGGQARLNMAIERLIAAGQLTRTAEKTGNRNTRDVLNVRA
jgi:RecA-family ATPase